VSYHKDSLSASLLSRRELQARISSLEQELSKLRNAMPSKNAIPVANSQRKRRRGAGSSGVENLDGPAKRRRLGNPAVPPSPKEFENVLCDAESSLAGREGQAIGTPSPPFFCSISFC
jgi:hypothetical protein